MKVLFICTGNVCRSPLAEAILRQKLQARGRGNIAVESAGTFNTGGMERDDKMQAMARNHGYDFGGTSVKMTREQLEDADLIIVMETHHRNTITAHLNYLKWDRIHLFCELCWGNDSEVPDPLYQSDQLYDQVFHTIEDGCEQLAQQLCR